MTETGNDMIVHYSHSLHKRIDYRRADKFKAALFQVLAYPVGERGAHGNVGEGFRAVDYRGVVNIAPDELIEAAEFALNFKERFGIGNGGVYFQLVADNSRVRQQLGDLFIAVLGDFARVEVVERLSEVFAFMEYCYPRKPRLHSLKYQHLEELAVVMLGATPFVVVVGYVYRVGARPFAAVDVVHVVPFQAKSKGVYKIYTPIYCFLIKINPLLSKH